MPIKKNFESNEDAINYIEELRQKNRERAHNYYHNVIQADPEKHKNHLEKCKQTKVKTDEEIEIAKQKKRDRSKKYYDNTVKMTLKNIKYFLKDVLEIIIHTTINIKNLTVEI
jgi:hypothetical protein